MRLIYSYFFCFYFRGLFKNKIVFFFFSVFWGLWNLIYLYDFCIIDRYLIFYDSFYFYIFLIVKLLMSFFIFI